MALTKIVNGREVAMPAAEEAAIRAEWAANAARPNPPRKPRPETQLRRLGARLGLSKQELDAIIEEPEV